MRECIHYDTPRLLSSVITEKNMTTHKIPTKQGQICKIVNRLPDENLAETYLILEDLASYSDDATIYVVSITDLQRNISNPTAAPRKAVMKSKLTVVAEDLTSYVESWNRS
ncbi:hypothetical protein CJD36_016710 [Flavipsychrobacter stenotrophus]|uniref:Uncharacterized protein n=1 Tax=Flavipsychrobacter stenotrophus TaxID=2077091 RepID=A0A2S7SRP6_9BACT|nr:hypothetical protein [Flavipsychrobacter stenotrophus]PQJ09580.1 hypothetical protein CJD36_016710 [Flavipsychrobacter stenotrophus]